MPTPPPAVVTAKATTETVPLTLELVGRTETPNAVSIRARVDGHVETRSFVEGDDVEIGQTLFVIDQRPYKSTLAQTVAKRDRNAVSLGFANRERDRISVLAQDGTAPEERLDQKTTAAAEAQGDLDGSQAAVDYAQVSLDYATVTAPIAGRIGRVYQDVGNVVTANNTVLVDIVQMDPLYVYVSPSEEQFLDLQKYRAENAGFEISITLIDGTKHPHNGSLDFISPNINPNTGTISVRAVFDNPDRLLRPGQYARVHVQLTEQPNQIVVPAEAITQDQTGFYTFVVGQDNTAEHRRVEVGRIYQGKRIVLSGLKVDEMVISKGQQRVKSGMVVRPQEPASDTKTDTKPSNG